MRFYFLLFLFPVNFLVADSSTIVVDSTHIDVQNDTSLILMLIKNPEKLPWEKGDSPLEAKKELTSLGFIDFKTDPPTMLEELERGTFKTSHLTKGGSLSCEHSSGKMTIRYRWSDSDAGMYLQDIIFRFSKYISWNNLYDKVNNLGYIKSLDAGGSVLRKTLKNSLTGETTVYQIQVQAYHKEPELLLVIVYKGK